MKQRSWFFAVILFFLPLIGVYSQNVTQGFPKIMYVTFREGIKERREPFIEDNVIKTFSYGETIQVFYRQSAPVTIDGITDYWYSTRSATVDSRAWVFGGHLSEDLPEDLPVVMGRWDVENDQRRYYQFGPDYSYAEGYKGTGMGLFGTWRINGNIITIKLTRAGTAGDELNKTIDIRLKIIDRNNIELLFPNNEIERLSRNRSGE